ncbi:MAG: ABC transporter permease [Syntrophaceae bacterium]|nr:ABC transporter permease [Syntrophaceae bacterium]
MGGYLLRRLYHSFIVILGITLIIFIITHMIGDPVVLLLSPEATQADRDELQRQLGLDRSLPLQYIVFIKDAVRGDFGVSFRHQRPALELVLQHLPATLELTLAAMVLSVLISLPLGILASMKPGSLLDRTGMTFALFGQSAPVFWIGIMFILLFGVKLRWFPISGRGGIENLVMPAMTLALFSTAAQTRLTRSSMLDVLDKDFIRTARSKGLHEFKVILKHAFKNALIPIITIVALQFGMMLSGAVITETIFAWPGVGRLAVNAIYNRDYPVIQAAVFVTSLFFIFINLLVDLIYTKIDPRITYR